MPCSSSPSSTRYNCLQKFACEQIESNIKAWKNMLHLAEGNWKSTHLWVCHFLPVFSDQKCYICAFVISLRKTTTFVCLTIFFDTKSHICVFVIFAVFFFYTNSHICASILSHFFPYFDLFSATCVFRMFLLFFILFSQYPYGNICFVQDKPVFAFCSYLFSLSVSFPSFFQSPTKTGTCLL